MFISKVAVGSSPTRGGSSTLFFQPVGTYQVPHFSPFVKCSYRLQMKWIPDQWIRGEKKLLHPRRVNNQQMKGPVYSCPFLWHQHCPSAVGRVCLPAESKSLITEWGSNVPSEWLYSQGPASGSEVGADSTGAAFRSLRLLLSASLPEKSTLPKWAVITQEGRGWTRAYNTILSANFSVLNSVSRSKY